MISKLLFSSKIIMFLDSFRVVSMPFVRAAFFFASGVIKYACMIITT